MEKSILLSMCHTLTDFFGANEFMKCILCFYFDIADSRPEKIRELLGVDPDDMRDPYTLYGSFCSPGFSMDKKWQNELEIPNRMQYRRGEPADPPIFLPIWGILRSKQHLTDISKTLMWCPL